MWEGLFIKSGKLWKVLLPTSLSVIPPYLARALLLLQGGFHWCHGGGGQASVLLGIGKSPHLLLSFHWQHPSGEKRASASLLESEAKSLDYPWGSGEVLAPHSLLLWLGSGATIFVFLFCFVFLRCWLKQRGTIIVKLSVLVGCVFPFLWSFG